jgi:hypothetical protein
MFEHMNGQNAVKMLIRIWEPVLAVSHNNLGGGETIPNTLRHIRPKLHHLVILDSFLG